MTDTSPGNIEPEPRWLSIIAFAGLGVICAFVTIGFLQYAAVSYVITQTKEANQNDWNPSAYGLSGDFFGLANAVFSALAFAMIIVTLAMQRYELRQQRIELRLTQDIFHQQKNEMEKQNSSLRRQTFENTFFSLLRMLGEIVSSLKHEIPSHGGTNFSRGGRDAVRQFAHEVGQILPNAAELSFDDQVNPLNNWFREHDAELGHYFRSLYNLILFVDEQGGELRFFYARLIRSQLSAGEVTLLACNSVLPNRRSKMKPFIEKYEMLKHLPESVPETIRGEYDPMAFGKAID